MCKILIGNNNRQYYFNTLKENNTFYWINSIFLQWSMEI